MWIFLNDAFLSVAGSDYAHRAWVPRQQVAEALAKTVEGLDYPNFKNTISDPAFHDAAMQVWGVMHRLQRRSG